jgi:hypothetical protein
MEKMVEQVVAAVEQAIEKRFLILSHRMDVVASSISDTMTGDQVKALLADALKGLPEPQDGNDGKDAAQIEVLPAIDQEKSYPRGTYATHDGGLWRSFEQTSGLRGWECIVNGIKAIDVEYDGERGFVVSIAKAFGDALRHEYCLPMLIDRGVYKSGQQYERFDVVTYGGALWIAQKDSTETAPGTSDEWRLSVKRGRDAKDKVRA